MMKTLFLYFSVVMTINEAYLVKPSFLTSRVSWSSPSPVVLQGKNSKRGRLGELAEDGGVVTPSRTRKSTRSSSNTKKTTSGGNNQISPALAEWMTQQEGGIESVSSTTPTVDKDDEEQTAVFEDFKKASSTRRVKQNIRKEQEEKRNKQIQQAVKSLEEALEENGNLDGILNAVRQLAGLESGNLRTLLASPKRVDYRLAWVGSDEAICHLGTGLHKVPLARLQEVFMSCLGRNRLEVSEVIRILGPFPNVRNILQGNTKLAKGSDVDTLNIVMDSMVDGTGKEILAGKEDNIRRVDLQVYFCDERAIVAIVPPEEGLREDPLEDSGANVLVFIKEDDLDEKLDKLRVS